MKKMTEVEEVIYHLLHVWDQYGKHSNLYGEGQKTLHFYHGCMTSGEQACDFLEKHGYALDAGNSVGITTKGLKLMGRAIYENEHDEIYGNGELVGYEKFDQKRVKQVEKNNNMEIDFIG